MRLSALLFTSLLAVSKLVQASPPVPRARGSSLSGLLSYLNGKGLTSLSNALNDAAKADGGNKITDALNSGQVTILAPNNDAFNSFKPSSDILDILLYHIVYGNIDTGFRTPDSLSRRLPLQNRNTGTSAYETNGLKTSARKRSSSFEDNQVQIIDQFVTASRKRWAPTSTIFINEAVGDAKVLERSSFKNIDIFTIGTVLAIPTAVSDLLCKPLIESAPGGFPKFGGSLQKAGLLDTVDNGKRITIFAPTDEAFDNIDLKDYSNNDLASLLKNHFSFGKVIYSPLFPTTPEITADSGNKIEITVVNGVQYVQCGHSRAQLRRSDVIASNGVMHVIDAVLKCD